METERITREDTDCENTAHFVRHAA